MTRRLLAVLGLLAAVVPASAQYRIIDLATLGGEHSEARAINDHGQIVGTADTPEGHSRGFLWQDGVMTDLGGLGGDWSEATGINDHGQIVGTAQTPEGHRRGFLWENGVMTDLGTLGGPASEARAINEHGQIAGTADTKKTDFIGEIIRHACLWENGAAMDLGALSEWQSEATAIDDAGHVAGWAEWCECWEFCGDQCCQRECTIRAFLWKDGVMTDVGVGELPYLQSTGARGINNRGHIVGWGTEDFPVSRALLWEDGVVTQLEFLAMWNVYGEATDINDAGQIVGESTTDEGYAHACLWQDGGITDLGVLSGPNSWANAINERGQIIGGLESYGTRGTAHGVLWNPLPVITAVEVTPSVPDSGIHVWFSAVPPTSTTAYLLNTADAACGPWNIVSDATLTNPEPDRYQFTVPFDAARAAAFWRVIETVP